MSRTTRVLLTLCACGAAITSLAEAKIIHVPGDSATIQAGIDGAARGDTVLVADGTYTGEGNRDVDFGGRNIVLVSENGPEFAVIDCQGTPADPQRGFHFHGGEDSTAVVRGFTIRGGTGSAAILCTSSSVSIIDCVVTDNDAGVWAIGSSLRLKYCTFRNNLSGAVACDDVTLIINNCYFQNNCTTEGNAIYLEATDAYLMNSVFAGNVVTGSQPGQGGAIQSHSSRLTVKGCTFVGNRVLHAAVDSTARSGGAIYFSSGSAQTDILDLERCLFAFNGVSDAGAVVYEPSGRVPFPATDCNFYSNGNDDWLLKPEYRNFSADPLFCAAAYEDYHLESSSPCLPENNAAGVLIGALGEGCSPVALSGDVNCDSLLDLTDVIIVGNVLDGFIDLTGTCSEGADDVNEDGVVNEDDYNLLYDVVAGVGP